MTPEDLNAIRARHRIGRQTGAAWKRDVGALLALVGSIPEIRAQALEDAADMVETRHGTFAPWLRLAARREREAAS